MRIFYFLIFFIGQVFICSAQSCVQFPADCPEYPKLTNEEDSIGYLKNLILPQEITMMKKLRRSLSEMMEEIASKNNWQSYLLTETDFTGYGKPEEPTPYELRPPYPYSIGFVFIINQDSLKAWQNWYKNDLLNASNDVVNSLTEAGAQLSQSDVYKKYSDSALFYGNEMSTYMTKHMQDYQAAIASKNQKDINKYEGGLKIFQDKINSCIEKANGERDKISSISNKKEENLQSMKHKSMVAYRNASMIRIKFNFNDRLFQTSISGSVRQVQELNIPGSNKSILMRNDHPDENEIFDLDQFIRSPLFAILLLGKWEPKMDQYKQYKSGFLEDPGNTDLKTFKKIKCDKAQTIGIHIEGNEQAIQQFLSKLNVDALNHLIVK